MHKPLRSFSQLSLSRTLKSLFLYLEYLLSRDWSPASVCKFKLRLKALWLVFCKVVQRQFELTAKRNVSKQVFQVSLGGECLLIVELAVLSETINDQFKIILRECYNEILKKRWTVDFGTGSIMHIFNNYSTSACWIWVGYNHLISNQREWNNCFIKNANKISRILPDYIC